MATIALDLDRGDVSVSDFTEALMAQVRLVREVMIEMGLQAQEVRWVVSDLRYGSTYAAAVPQVLGEHVFMADIDRAIGLAGTGVRSLAGSAERPPFFSDEALKTSRRLIQLVAESDAGKARLRFGLEDVTLSESMVSNVETLIKGNVASIGSIEGKLVSVASKEGSYRIAVKDRLRGRNVPCAIPKDLLAGALKAFESRVVVRGIVWSRADGSAVRIDVRDLEVIPSDDLLPSGKEIRGILRDFRVADAD